MPKDGTIMQLGKRHGATLSTLKLDCDGLHDPAIVNGVALCPNLKVFIITSQETEYLTDKSLVAISASLKNLTHLSIDTASFSSAGLTTFFTSSPSLAQNLTYFCLISVPGLDQGSAVGLGQNFKALKRLVVVMSGPIGDVGLIAIGENCTKLEALRISGDDSVQLKADVLKNSDTAAPLFPSLKKFDLDDCDEDAVDKEFLNIMVERQPNPVVVLLMEMPYRPQTERV